MSTERISERLRALRGTSDLPAPDALLARAFPDVQQRSDAPHRPLLSPFPLMAAVLVALAFGPLWLRPGPRDRAWCEGLLRSTDVVVTQIGKWNPQ